MEEVVRIDSITQFNEGVGIETFHPLVSVVDFEKVIPKVHYGKMKISYGFYTIYLKEIKCGDIKYGCNYYDYQDGTLVFIGPGQVLSIENYKPDFKPKGWSLRFHPDLIRGTSLGQNIRNYNFFSYEVNEALHLSESERHVVLDCLNKIDNETRRPIDKHSKTLIVSNIELLLNYCVRFYDRQFITRSHVNIDILVRFERLLDDYFHSGKTQLYGLPSVKYFADELNLSAGYFGELIKKETGKSAQEYIQLKLMDIAKDKLHDTSKSVSEIAYELGFKYPQHFTRLFKSAVGHSPNEYRNRN